MQKNQWPSLEVRIKSLNYVGNLLLEQLQRFYDKRSVRERYLSGDLECHHHWFEGAYCAKTTVVKSSIDSLQSPVFVGIGEVPKGSGPLATETRLQPLERCLMVGRKAMYPELAELSFWTTGRWEKLFPILFVAFDDKLRSTMFLSRIQAEKLKNEVIEGGSEIIDRLPNKDGNDWGSFDCLLSAAEESAGYGSRDCPLRRKDGRYLPFEASDMFFCPTNSRTSIIKGWLREIGICHDKSRCTA